MLLNNEWVGQQGNQRGNQKIHGEKCKWKHNVQNIWDAAKVVITGTFIAVQAHLQKQEKSQICNLTLQLRGREKEEQIKPQTSRSKEIIKSEQKYRI